MLNPALLRRAAARCLRPAVAVAVLMIANQFSYMPGPRATPARTASGRPASGIGPPRLGLRPAPSRSASSNRHWRRQGGCVASAAPAATASGRPRACHPPAASTSASAHHLQYIPRALGAQLHLYCCHGNDASLK